MYYSNSVLLLCQRHNFFSANIPSSLSCQKMEIKKEVDDELFNSIVVKEEYIIHEVEEEEIDLKPEIESRHENSDHVAQFEITEIDQVDHDGKKRHKCPICSRCFERPSKLEKHLVTHTLEKNFHCSKCEKSFGTRDSLQKHEKIHLEGVLYPCNICQKVFKNGDYLRRHIFRHTSIRHHECEICGKVFLEKFYMTRHIQQAHEGKKRYEVVKSKRKPLVCPTCGKIFCEKIPYERHLTVHTDAKPEACSICARRFKHYADLNRHMAIHRTEKPFACEICGSSFNRREYLRSHSLTHKEKSLRCHYCPAIFGRGDYRKSHIKRLHRGLPIHLKGGPYSCTICQESFPDIDSIKEHVAQHPKKMKYQREICEKQFNRDKTLIAHKLKCNKISEVAGSSGSGELLSCAICSRRFPDKDSIAKHMLLVHENGNKTGGLKIKFKLKPLKDIE